MQDDDKTAEKPDPVKAIDHNAAAIGGGAGRMSAARLSKPSTVWAEDLRRLAASRKETRAAQPCLMVG